MKINQYLHTAILVSDLTQAERFYGATLGLEKVPRSLNYPGVWYQIGPYQLHLMVETNVTSQLTNPQKWGRNPHIAFSVNDLALAKQQLEAGGYAYQMSASGRAALFAQDPDGNIIEINQAA